MAEAVPRDQSFFSRLFPASLDFQAPAPLTGKHWFVFAVIMVVAGLARFALLDRIPPGLWYDEALYALDGYGVSQRNFAIFFDVHGHPREPLFPWMLGLVFWLFEPTVLVARAVSAVAGTVAVALFFPVARRFFPANWALAATAAFAVFRWHVHFSRTIFRAGLASPLILLVVWLFLRWREKRRNVDAALCGAAVGACLYTYISLRVVPLLLALWIVWLALKGALSLRREWKQIAVLYGTALVVFLPLGVDYARNPGHFFGRTDEISMFENRETRTLPDGTTREANVPKPIGEAISGIARNASQVAGAWFVIGDHVAKHNIPYRPVFDPATGLFFALGIGICGWALVRTGAFLPAVVLTWFGAFAMASVLSFGAPNILRMQGASPVVILVMVLGLYRATQAWPADRAGSARKLVPVLVLVFFAGSQLWDYFGVFPNDMRVRQEFTADFFHAPAVAVDRAAEQVDRVYVPAEMAENLQFQFTTVRRNNIVPYKPEDVLAAPGAGESAAWLVTMRSESLADAAGNSQVSQIRDMDGAILRETLRMPVHVDGKQRGYQSWAELWVRADK